MYHKITRGLLARLVWIGVDCYGLVIFRIAFKGSYFFGFAKDSLHHKMFIDVLSGVSVVASKLSEVMKSS